MPTDESTRLDRELMESGYGDVRTDGTPGLRIGFGEPKQKLFKSLVRYLRDECDEYPHCRVLLVNHWRAALDLILAGAGLIFFAGIVLVIGVVIIRWGETL